MTDTYAEELILNKFLELKGLSKDKKGDVIDVALPNKAFTRPANGYWYEVYPIPAVPVQIELGSGGRSRWVGVIHVDVCVPKNVGTKAAYARFDAIAELFRSGLIIKGVRIVRTYRTSALEDGDFYTLPVAIEWWADLDR